jgi:hypothetical protein
MVRTRMVFTLTRSPYVCAWFLHRVSEFTHQKLILLLLRRLWFLLTRAPPTYNFPIRNNQLTRAPPTYNFPIRNKFYCYLDVHGFYLDALHLRTRMVFTYSLYYSRSPLHKRSRKKYIKN